ncbi:MAG TPA: hypothetical protein VK911_09620, partial [Vicinamibacterales bacterium]|nr:hypothetical protein [Vicinamibacterales bacterium]
MSEFWSLVFGSVQGLTVLAVFLLVVLLGFSLLGDRTKFRATRGSKTVRNLDERLGVAPAYLPPEAPR